MKASKKHKGLTGRTALWAQVRHLEEWQTNARAEIRWLRQDKDKLKARVEELEGKLDAILTVSGAEGGICKYCGWKDWKPRVEALQTHVKELEWLLDKNSKGFVLRGKTIKEQETTVADHKAAIARRDARIGLLASKLKELEAVERRALVSTLNDLTASQAQTKIEELEAWKAAAIKENAKVFEAASGLKIHE